MAAPAHGHHPLRRNAARCASTSASPPAATSFPTCRGPGCGSRSPWWSPCLGDRLLVVREAIGTGSSSSSRSRRVVLAAWLGRFVGGFIATVPTPSSPRLPPPNRARRAWRMPRTRARSSSSSWYLARACGRGDARRQEVRRSGRARASGPGRGAGTRTERIEVLLANLPGLIWELRVERGVWPPPVDFVSASAWRLTGHPAESRTGTELLCILLRQRSGRASKARCARRWRRAAGTAAITGAPPTGASGSSTLTSPPRSDWMARWRCAAFRSTSPNSSPPNGYSPTPNSVSARFSTARRCWSVCPIRRRAISGEASRGWNSADARSTRSSASAGVRACIRGRRDSRRSDRLGPGAARRSAHRVPDPSGGRLVALATPRRRAATRCGGRAAELPELLHRRQRAQAARSGAWRTCCARPNGRGSTPNWPPRRRTTSWPRSRTSCATR